MGKALYRAYRSRKLSEIVGQEHITTALQHALEKGTISHAYLFTGPRGVGKTSIARILAHEINGLPYTDDEQHLDIIEIDAASNRRIDEIRDLREKVNISPTSAKYKVYIIDEVHMLTKEAFNALLKTLEEPPAHVIFILATTEVHKLPATIISRTQRYAFKPVDVVKVTNHLRSIAKKEKIQISDAALALVAAHGEGSFRDSISLLDQVRNSGSKIELADVQVMLGVAPQEMISTLLKSLETHDSLGIAQTSQHMQDQGYEAAQVAKQLGISLRGSIIDSHPVLPHESIINLLYRLVQVPSSADPRIALEIALLDAALETPPEAASPKTMPVDVQPQPTIAQPAKRPVPKPVIKDSKASKKPDDTAPATTLLSGESWELILQAVKQNHSTLYGIAKMAQPSFEPGKLTLWCSRSFYQQRLNDEPNKRTLGDIIAEVTGSQIQVIAVVGQLPVTKEEPVIDPENKPIAAVDTISNIFGGAELLEL
jgi:DNA polymerase-3 subunit gamma/tau